MIKNRTISKILCVCAIGATLVPIASCSSNDGFFTVMNGKNLEVTFCDTGASIYSIYYKGTCITYQPEDKNYFKHTEKNSGKILGRTCGRIDRGKVKINGKEYQLDRNEHTDLEGGNTLHGGHKGVGTQNFKHKIKKNKDNQQIIFTYTSPDGEMGYPGTVDFKITYTLFNDSDKIRLDMEGTPRTNDPTPICLSGHTYWNLGGNNTDGIKNHQLKIPAKQLANSRKDDQVIGPNPITIEQKGWFDFNEYKPIGEDIGKVAEDDDVALGYDHGWIFDESVSQINEVNLWNPTSKIHLAVDTDIDMVFIYANCHAVGCKIKDYGTDLQYGGVSIEPMTYMDNTGVDEPADANTYETIMHTHDNPFKQFIEYNIDIKDSVDE